MRELRLCRTTRKQSQPVQMDMPWIPYVFALGGSSLDVVRWPKRWLSTLMVYWDLRVQISRSRGCSVYRHGHEALAVQHRILEAVV
jgi:hypothetical protein